MARIVLPFLLLLSSNSAGAEGDPAPALAEVRALLDRQVIDWNRGDLDGFLAAYWDSPRVVFQSGGDRVEGFAAIRDRFRKSYQAEGKEMGKLAFTDLDVVPIAPDAALARARWGLVKRDGSKVDGLFTLVLRKLPEGWRVVHDHTSSVKR